jgi:GDPmannose 4,6-dehydratase
MQTKVALIAGITCRDSALLAESLLRKGYEVHGINSPASLPGTNSPDSMFQNPDMDGAHFVVHGCDLTDPHRLTRLMQALQPDEVYNLTAQSCSNQHPELLEQGVYAAGFGALRLLEAIRVSGLAKKTRFYQAGTHELRILVQGTEQKERDALRCFGSLRPDVAASLYAYWITVSYRDNYGMYACNGVFFNSESPVHGERVITRNITRAVARVAVGVQDCVRVANLSLLRDWGRARDYVEMQWLMLQQSEPKDFAIATGHQRSVRNFVRSAFAALGVDVQFEGDGEHEIGRVLAVANEQGRCKPGDVIVRVDPRRYVDPRIDPWSGAAPEGNQRLIRLPTSTFDEFVSEAMAPDFAAASRSIHFKADISPHCDFRA